MPSGTPARGERRALLDVRLDEARGRGLEPAARRQLAVAERGERLAERSRRRRRAGRPRRARACRRRARLPKTPRPKRGPSSSRNATATERRSEPPSTRDRLERVERREHAERAVEATAVGRRVEVRAAPDLGQRRARADERPVQVAGRVERDLEPGLGHPAGDQLERALLALAEARPVRAGRSVPISNSASRRSSNLDARSSIGRVLQVGYLAHG